MNTAIQDTQEAARAHAFSVPLADIDPSNPDYFEHNTVGHYFERLRRDAPVHRAHSPIFGPYWSITRYQDIMAVDTNHKAFSSSWELGGITITDEKVEENRLQMFIAMDPPKHDVQRKAVTPIVAPGNLANMEALIRFAAIEVLDAPKRVRSCFVRGYSELMVRIPA